jgi:hypothetical protein
MTEKFTYYMYLDATWTEVAIFNNELSLVYKVDENNEDTTLKELEGGFSVKDSVFDALIDVLPEPVLFRIYENGDILTGDLVIFCGITEFNDIDYNQKTMGVKSFDYFSNSHLLVNLIENGADGYIDIGTAYDIDYDLDGTITSKAYKFENIIDPFLGILNFNIHNAWYDTEMIGLDQIRFANLKDIAWVQSVDATRDRKKINLKKILEIIQVMFRGHAYMDDDYLRFKAPVDLVTNIYDASLETTHLYQRYYQYDKRFAIEQIKYNPTNQIYTLGNNGPYEESDCIIDYERTIKESNIYNLQEICTLYQSSVADDINLDGWFMAHVSNANDKVTTRDIIGTASSYENGYLVPANIIGYFYRDYIWTDKTNYTYYGIQETVEPTHFKPFIRMPDFTTVLNSVLTFYDGIKFYGGTTKNDIARVYKQKINLNTNQTTFESYLFKYENLS